MKRAIQWFLFVAAFVPSVALCASASAQAVEQTPPELDDSPVLVTGYHVDNGAPTFIQLYNDSSALISLDGWKIEFEYLIKDAELRELAEPRTYEITLSNWILSEKYAVLSRDDIVENADANYEIDADLSLYEVTGLRLIPPAEKFLPYIVEEVDGGEFTTGAWRQLSKSDAGNYTSGSDFEIVRPDENGEWPPLYGHGLYDYPDQTPLRIVEILANPADCAPLQYDANCREFIKIYNPTNEAVDLGQFRLRFGHGNERPGIGNTVQLEGVLPAERSYYAVMARDDGEPLEITASGGSVWLEDAWGLTTYEATVYTHPDIGDNDYKGFSWALDKNGTWRWATASPSGANNFSIPAGLGSVDEDGLRPCDPNQYRSPVTNRCRLIDSDKSDLKPCDPDEYRSPETNRCRNINSSSGDLKPCDPGEYRNPDTNRCRDIKGASTDLKPCDPGERRNPETNRCRKHVTEVPEAAFAPAPIEKVGQRFTGWWVLGGIGTAALGRWGWEWREEVRRLLEKAGKFFNRRK